MKLDYTTCLLNLQFIDSLYKEPPYYEEHQTLLEVIGHTYVNQILRTNQVLLDLHQVLAQENTPYENNWCLKDVQDYLVAQVKIFEAQ